MPNPEILEDVRNFLPLPDQSRDVLCALRDGADTIPAITSSVALILQQRNEEFNKNKLPSQVFGILTRTQEAGFVGHIQVQPEDYPGLGEIQYSLLPLGEQVLSADFQRMEKILQIESEKRHSQITLELGDRSPHTLFVADQ
jgi:hypothetical protein